MNCGRFLKSFAFATACFASMPAKAAVEIDMPAPILDAWRATANDKTLAYDVKMWIQSVLGGKTEDAAHNWGVISEQLPEKLVPLGDATYLVLVLREGLYQTFSDRLITLLHRETFLKSPAWAALEPALNTKIPMILEEGTVTFGPDQKAALAALPWTGIATDLKGFAALRGGAAAEEALKHVAEDRPWRFRLALTASLAAARAGRLDDAIKILTPVATAKSTPAEGKAQVDLALARIYYQQVDLKNAEAWYEKIPVDSPHAAPAREELLWVWLRTGDVGKLRGTVESLNSADFKNRFQPETMVVRAISDLKLCMLDNAKHDFETFVSENSAWAKQIETAVKAEEPPASPNADWYSAFVEKAIAQRKVEIAKTESLGKESIAASVPSVGQQAHWLKMQKELTTQVARLDRQRSAEAHRQWRNDATMLQEAIRKMQFVKVELLSQLGSGIKANPTSETSAQEAKKADQAIDKAGEEGWTFPVDGAAWSDELFALRSTAHSVCL